MISMEPMSTTVSDETLVILRRFYPPPDDTADKLLYEGDQYVRLSCGSITSDMEKRTEPICRDRDCVRDSPSKKIQEAN